MTDALTGALRSFDPAVRPPELAGGDVAYVVEDVAVGRLLLAARPDGTLLTSAYVPTDADADALLDRLARLVSPGVVRGGTAVDAARRQLDEYLAGRRRTFDVATDTVLATPFQRTVLDRLARDVGYGATTSYGTLAAAVGRPSASRAVGTALGGNPLCIVLPCHRVVAASGALSGYAGGADAKRRLLALEAAAPA
jgi:methylated-DNA-[protein]-cysteine S-methyltransferase